MGSTTRVWLRRSAALVAVTALAATYQWADGAQFGGMVDGQNASDKRSTPREPGVIEDEFADRLLREDEFYRQRAYPNDLVPRGALADAQVEADALPVITEIRGLDTTDTVIAPGPLAPGVGSDAFSLPSSVAWTQVGTRGITAYTNPFNDFYNGSTPLSGRVVAIANHPSDADTAYIGSASGGLFKTTDGGTSWTPLFDDQPTLAVSAIAIDPDAPNTVYVGTGEGSGGRYYGQGVFKSTDGGATWTKLAIGTGGTALDYCHIADVVALGGGSSNVVVAVSLPIQVGPPPANACIDTAIPSASTGAWTSTNDGATWTHVYSSSGVTDLAIDSGDPATVYGGDRDEAMIYSFDSGVSFFGTNGTAPALTGQVKVAAGDSGVVYAAIEKVDDFSLLGIYKSTDFGVNFSPISDPDDICNYPKFAPSDPLVAQCNYDFDLAVDTSPVGADHVYLAGIFLGRSIDGGITFDYSGNDPNDNFETKQLHVDVQKLSFDASGRLWVATDGGIQRTSDGTTFTNVNANLNLQQFQHGISTAPSGRLFGGTQDLGSTRYTTGPGWEMWETGDGGAGAVDPRDPDVVYGTYIYGQTYVSTDGGQTTLNLNSADCMGEGVGNCLFYAPFEMDPARPDTLFTGTFRVYRTTDGWATQPFPISNAFGDTVSAIAPAPSDEKYIYAGTSSGGLHVTDDAGITAAWPLRTTGLPNRAITDILVDPNDAVHAWVTVSGFGSGHVFETFDAGLTWFDVSGNLPDAPVNAIDADFRNVPPSLFVGTDVGVFASGDSGASWAQYGTGLPKITTLDVLVNSATNTVTAGSSGRGMWTAAIGCPVPVNDQFADAAVLTGTTDTDTGDNTCAGVEFGEPVHNTPSDPLPTNTLWWTWKAPGSGSVTIDTVGSPTDTVLAVYTGTTPSSATKIAGNDDIDLTGGNLQSRVSFDATAGVTYRIAVDGYSVADTGGVTVNLSATLTDVITALAPGRIYETRQAPNTTVDSQQTGLGRTTAGQVVEVEVAGRAGVPADAAAAVLNITAIRPADNGFITSFPCGTSQPLTASLNFAAGETIANGAIIKLGTGGKVCIFTTSATDLVVDVTGFAPTGSDLGALVPGRVYETRSAPNTTIDGQQTGVGRTTAGEVVEVEVAGRAGVPADAAAVVLNITAIRPTDLGFITSFPCGSPQPLTASLNFAAGQIIANGAAIKVGTGGKVCIFTSSATDLVVDVTGHVPATQKFGSLTPGRVYETRSAPNTTVDGQQTGLGRTTAGEVVEVEVAGRAGVPTNAVAAVLNITAIRPTDLGFITSFPCGSPQPLTASLNFGAGQTIANGAIIKLGTGGKVCIFTSSATDLVVDVTGFLS